MNNYWIDAIRKILEPSVLKYLMNGVLITLTVAVLSIIFSLILGIILAIAKNSSGRLISTISFVYIEIMRNIPLLLLIIAIRFLTPLNTLYSGIVSISLFSSAMIAEIIRGGLNSVKSNQWESAISQGFNRLQSIQYVILPQVINNMYEPLINYFVSIVKDTSLCATIGLYELFFASKMLVSQTNFVRAEDVIVVYLFVAMIYYIINIVISKVLKSKKVASYLKCYYNI